MDDELIDAIEVLANHCREHEGCYGCPFFSRISFLKQSEGHCALTDRVPEDWSELYS